MTRLSEKDTENLIRDSLERLAARAPDGDEVREALAGSQQSRRRPKLALALVAAAVAVIALGVPVGMQALSGPDKMPPSSQRYADWAVLPYAPGWLPDGFRELGREARPYPAPQKRTWGGGDNGTVELSTTPLSDEWSAPWTIAPVRDQIIVHGKVGMVTELHRGSTMLTWSPDDAYLLILTLYGVQNPREVGQRIADSMVKEGTERVEGELRFGSLPTDLALSSVRTYAVISGEATDIQAGPVGLPLASVGTIKATIGGAAPDLAGAEPVTARGTNAFYRPPPRKYNIEGQDDGMVAVQVTGGRWLTVSGRRDRAELIETANTIQLVHADYGWIGSRPE
jgi:hypothetical protein